MRIPIIVAGIVLVVVGALATRYITAETVVEVYKTPSCGCCVIWVDYMKEKGFTVEMIDQPHADRARVPGHLASCHTAYIDRYIIEGHIPAEDVRRLLKEQPQVSGLVLPGMPEGSPGMEGPNPVAYDVFTFNSDGDVQIYASHNP